MKELDALDQTIFKRIDRKINGLADEPRPAGGKKLQGSKDLWRVRVGDYRVIYSINDARQVLDVMRVAHRRDVYE